MSDGSMNLTVARGDKSVWDKPGFRATLATYDQERWMAAAWGSALAILGGRRGGFTGGLLAMAGAAVAVRAAMGHHDVNTARQVVQRTMQNRGWHAPDVVMESSEASFPASDSPSWTPTAGARAER
jgi:uncharacterized membrane protein